MTKKDPVHPDIDPKDRRFWGPAMRGANDEASEKGRAMFGYGLIMAAVLVGPQIWRALFG